MPSEMANFTSNATTWTTALPTEFYGEFHSDPFSVHLTANIPYVILLSLLFIATLAGNCFVFRAVYVFRELRTVTNYFVVSLSCADVCVAILAMPYWVLHSFLLIESEEDQYNFELGIMWIDVFCCAASIVNATLVSFDRYYAIIQPLRYNTVVTPRRAKIAMVTAWGYAVVLTLLSFLRFHPDFAYEKAYIVVLFICIFCLPLIVMSFAYFSIYKAAIAQIIKLDSVKLTKFGEERLIRSQAIERRKRFFKELRITKTLALIVFLFVLCWSPYLVVTLIEAFDPSPSIPVEVQAVIVWLPYVLSCANPWLYTGMSRDFRNAFKKLYCNNKKCRKGKARKRERGNEFSKSVISATSEEPISALSKNNQPTENLMNGRSHSDAVTSVRFTNV